MNPSIKRRIPVWSLCLSALLPLGWTTLHFPGAPAMGAGTTEIADAPPMSVADGRFRCHNGRVSFKSDAALEVIQAKSNKLNGIIDPENQTFAWSLELQTFEGFNSALQREHFKENYLETDEFPKAIFQGKIIEKIDFQKDGTYSVRAKGKLLIHGVEQERILNSQMELKNGKAIIHSAFTVLLSDHNINIPRVVHQKIAEEIAVTVDAELKAS